MDDDGEPIVVLKDILLPPQRVWHPSRDARPRTTLCPLGTPGRFTLSTTPDCPWR